MNPNNSKEIPKLSAEIQARFWEKVGVGPSEACWLWKAGRFQSGYGQFGLVGGPTMKAHRVAYALSTGDSVAGRVICHKCDTPLCCNPSHLFAANATTNSADMVAKRRQAYGERNYKAKLSEAQVMDIRARYKPGVLGHWRLAKEYGVNRSTIRMIVLGKHWRYLAKGADRGSVNANK